MRKLIFALVVAAGATTAQADPIRFDFTTTFTEAFGGFPTDPVADGFGFVIFDPDTFMPAGGNGFVGDGINALPSIAISFDWFGQHYDSSSAGLWGVNFVGGLPDSFAIGGLARSCGGIQTFGCVASASSDFDLATNPNGTGLVAFAIDGVEGNARGTVSWRQVPVSVP